MPGHKVSQQHITQSIAPALLVCLPPIVHPGAISSPCMQHPCNTHKEYIKRTCKRIHVKEYTLRWWIRVSMGTLITLRLHSLIHRKLRCTVCFDTLFIIASFCGIGPDKLASAHDHDAGSPVVVP